MMTGIAPPVAPGGKMDRNPRTAEKRLKARQVSTKFYNWRELNFIYLSANNLTKFAVCQLIDENGRVDFN